MVGTSTEKVINIRPGVRILSVLRYLNYKPWYALAEYVDNSLQSYLSHRINIKEADGSASPLKIELEISATDGGSITIRDNAAGIFQSEYEKAFRPAEVPLDQSGLGEFGMGMKSASCWFARNWRVRTKALGETVEKTVHFDIEEIVNDSIEELKIIESPKKAGSHYTEIVLENLYHQIQPRTLGKIREHLASIYRIFLRDERLELRVNGEILGYDTPKILDTPYYKDQNSKSKEWHKKIDIDLGNGMSVRGFAALRQHASTTYAGFALFRRERLIQGSGDESYRPEKIFGHSNSYRYQRLFGELHLKGFGVSHTKDGFHWGEYEGLFLDKLRAELDAEPLPLLRQAEGYRSRAAIQDLKKAAELATKRTAEMMERSLPSVLDEQLEDKPDTEPPPKSLPDTRNAATEREINVEFGNHKWQILLRTTIDPAIGEWVKIGDHTDLVDPKTSSTIRCLAVSMSLEHPFVVRFCGADPEAIEALLRIAAGLAIAEATARDAGAKLTSTIIRDLNRLLRDALCKP